MTDQPAEFLTLVEAGAYGKKHPDSIRKWTKTGRLPFRRGVRGRIVVRRADLDRILFGESDEEPVKPVEAKR